MAEPLWSFVTADKRKIPETAMKESAKSVFRNLLNRMGSGQKISSFSIDAELRFVPSHLLDMVAPVPDWNEAAGSFLDSLKQWDDHNNGALVRPVLIGSSGSATSQILNIVASQKNYTVLMNPSLSEVLEGGSSWLKNHPFDLDATYVIPELEKFYFRHHLGLSLIRTLIREINDKEVKIVIGCDSWAWAYLTKVIGLCIADSSTLTLEALDGILLRNWFSRLASLSCRTRFTFRSSDTGEIVLAFDDDQDSCSTILADEGNGQHSEQAEIFKHIASRSRGIPLVAWAIWRQCLELASDEATDDNFFQNTASSKPSGIWVAPWSQVVLPHLIAPAENLDLLFLYTLLIHAGLTSDALAALLPFSEVEQHSIMERLSTAGLIKLDNGEWRVTLLGYPSIRDNLSAEGYLLDEI